MTRSNGYNGCISMNCFRYHSTNCFFLSGPSGKLMAFDAGWPCTRFEYSRMMKTIGLRFDDIAWALVSHMHMDHAGLLGEFLGAGVECWISHEQWGAIDDMERVILKNSAYRGYKSIDKTRLKVASIEELNSMCARIGIGGEVIATPGHSPDSLSYISAERDALIGDLAPRDQIMPEDTVSRVSWELIAELSAKRAFPSHAEVIIL